MPENSLPKNSHDSSEEAAARLVLWDRLLDEGMEPSKLLQRLLGAIPQEQVRLLLTQPQALANLLSELSDAHILALLHDWEGVWARPSQLLPPGDWNTWLILAGRGFGKMLDADTPIPTPSGWNRLGSMNVGDELFDESGRPCRILRTFDGMPGTAYRLTFSDGTTLDACGDHQWVTWTHAERKAFLRSPYENPSKFPSEWPAWRLRRRLGGTDLSEAVVQQAIELHVGGLSARDVARRLSVCRQALARHLSASRWLSREPVVHPDSPGPQIRTTQQIVDSLTYGSRGDLNHCIPVCGALVLPPVELPVEPYVLGLWLGDGTSRDGSLTAHESDQPHVRAALEAAGFQTTKVSDPQRIGTRWLFAKLRAAGVLNNKHVPPIYLRASAEQRLALLQGLMDTDGCVTPDGHAEFCNTNEGLARGVLELARSLGQRAAFSVGRSVLYGVDKGPKFRVLWTPTAPVFRMQRKLERIKLQHSLAIHHRMITGATRIEPKPMRCLTVDSRHSMFLAGEAMVPTHNTRTGAETTRLAVEKGLARRIALVAPTSADARDTMVEGVSGILAVCPPWLTAHYEPSKRRVTWRRRGREIARATLFSAEEPERLRGPQHDWVWGDEPASWANASEVWAQICLGLRLGAKPRAVITGTPKPVDIILSLLKDPGCVVTRGNTYENRDNLAASYFDQIERLYGNSRLGRQEIYAEVLEAVAGIFDMAKVEAGRIERLTKELDRIVVAVDPAQNSGSSSNDETGIMVVGVADGHGYVLEDASIKGSPDTWASRVSEKFHEWRADSVVAEVNVGGEMVEFTMRTVDPTLPVKTVRAMRGKAKRAEPIAALFEQGRIHLVGSFPKLEQQMRTFTGINGKRDDRTDAMCWGFHELLVTPEFIFV